MSVPKAFPKLSSALSTLCLLSKLPLLFDATVVETPN